MNQSELRDSFLRQQGVKTIDEYLRRLGCKKCGCGCGCEVITALSSARCSLCDDGRHSTRLPAGVEEFGEMT
jgi:hypothetical protein